MSDDTRSYDKSWCGIESAGVTGRGFNEVPGIEHETIVPAFGGLSKSVPFSLPVETLGSINASCDLYRNAMPSLKAATSSFVEYGAAMDSIREVADSFPSLAVTLPDYSSLFQNIKPALAHFSELAKRLTSDINFGAIAESVKPVALRFQRINLLDRANWPLYLVDDSSMCDALNLLSDDMTDVELRGRVSEIAFDRLNADWLTETRLRWNEHDELKEGERSVLMRALDRHGNGDYEGCVALLMNLFEGLLAKYVPMPNVLDGEDAELFDWQAERFRVRPSHGSDGKFRKLNNAKDKVLMLVVLSDNGWYVIDHAVRYIVGVTLTNGMDSALAAHNPLRNKICHGEQTEYGTLEHSLKAILVTDIVIRYGAAILEGRADLEYGA